MARRPRPTAETARIGTNSRHGRGVTQMDPTDLAGGGILGRVLEPES